MVGTRPHCLISAFIWDICPDTTGGSAPRKFVLYLHPLSHRLSYLWHYQSFQLPDAWTVGACLSISSVVHPMHCPDLYLLICRGYLYHPYPQSEKQHDHLDFGILVSGVRAMNTFLTILVFVLFWLSFTSLYLAYRGKPHMKKIFIIILILNLITFMVWGFMRNTNPPFWA